MSNVQQRFACAFTSLECFVRDTLKLMCVLHCYPKAHNHQFDRPLPTPTHLFLLRVAFCLVSAQAAPVPLTVVGVFCLVIPVNSGSRKTSNFDRFSTAIQAKIGSCRRSTHANFKKPTDMLLLSWGLDFWPGNHTALAVGVSDSRSQLDGCIYVSAVWHVILGTKQVMSHNTFLAQSQQLG